MFALALMLLADAPVVAAVPAKPADTMVCKAAPRTNTRFAKKVCTRKSDLDAQSIADQRAAAEQISQPAINPASNGS